MVLALIAHVVRFGENSSASFSAFLLSFRFLQIKCTNAISAMSPSPPTTPPVIARPGECVGPESSSAAGSSEDARHFRWEVIVRRFVSDIRIWVSRLAGTASMFNGGNGSGVWAVSGWRVSGFERVTGVRARERGVPEIRATIVIKRGSAVVAVASVASALLAVCGRTDAEFYMTSRQRT